MRTFVSRQFRQFVLGKYPNLVGNEPFLRFFRYICFSNFVDDQRGQLVIPTTTMAEEFYKQPYTHRFNGKATLEEFRRQVLPQVAWTEHRFSSGNATDPYKGRAREITCLGFDAEMHGGPSPGVSGSVRGSGRLRDRPGASTRGALPESRRGNGAVRSRAGPVHAQRHADPDPRLPATDQRRSSISAQASRQ